jgi:hypothetical protein
VISQIVGIVLAVASLPPHEKARAEAPYSCNTIRKLVAMFGETLVMAEARRRGVSEDTISRTKRRCLEDK